VLVERMKMGIFGREIAGELFIWGVLPVDFSK